MQIIILENNLIEYWERKYKLLKRINYANNNYIRDFKNKKSIIIYYYFLKYIINT